MGRSVRNPRRFTDPFAFDRDILQSVCASRADQRLAGADEAGRGSLAGPLVAAAVVLDYADAPFDSLEGLSDSKLLSPAIRENLFRNIICRAKTVSWVSLCAGTIDREGLHRSNLAALARALESCHGQYAHALVDGFDIKRPDLNARALVRGDFKSAAVAAASVVAKVVRDRLMKRLALMHPEYGFDTHVGYGTKAHSEALVKHGPCRLHRMSFRQVGTTQLGLWDHSLGEG